MKSYYHRKKNPWKFYYRGMIERGSLNSGYRWVRGYSYNSRDGCVTYPWMTKRECQHLAMRFDRLAVFVEEQHVLDEKR